MTQRKRELGPAERAVYALVSRGDIDALHAPLYRRQLSALAGHGLVRRTDNGRFEAIQGTPPALATPEYPPNPANGTYHIRAAEPAPEPPPEPTETIVARVPKSVIDLLDSQAPDGNRSEAIRRALIRGLGSGVRKAVKRTA